MERLILVSSDSHAGLSPEEYRPYFDPQYRDAVAMLAEDYLEFEAMTKERGYPFAPEVLEVVDDRNAIRTGGEAGFYDVPRRLREAEAEGVCAEILHPDGPLGLAPFFCVACRRVSIELRAAGAKAHNRFLEDFCREAPGRLIGVAIVEPWPDMRSAVKEIHHAKDVGFGAVCTPNAVGLAGYESELPPFYTSFWDPFWAACSEVGLPVDFHAGFGLSPGSVKDFAAEVKANAAAGSASEEEALANLASEVFDSLFMSRRPLLPLIWGGVFDRYPGLKVVFSEVRGDWIPPTLAYLDDRHAQGRTSLNLRPSEYWRHNCAVACSCTRRPEVELRSEIGIDRFMFGTDYPHMEGTWPNTLDWLRATLVGVPERDARRILGENAIDFYGLDRAPLVEIAERIGPRPEEVLGTGHHVDPDVIAHFDFRSGYLKRPRFDVGELAQALDEEEGGIATRVVSHPES